MDLDNEIEFTEGSADERSLRDGSENDSAEADAYPISLAGPSTPKWLESQDDEYPSDVLSVEEIVAYMISEINDVKEIMEWEKDKLLEKFYDTNQEELFQEAHVVNPLTRGLASSAEVDGCTAGAAGEHCQICLADQPSSSMTGLACGHRFCTRCWSEYLTTKVMDDGVGQTISCAAHGCDILVDDETVMRLVSEPRVLQRYQHLITNSFVECSRCLCWCPGADCGRAVRVPYPEARPVRCLCGLRFCFACSERWHDPVRCRLVKRWRRKCDDDSETSHWLSANTKECPKCNATIEKDGGCNHIICKNQSCRADFCWVCLGPWEPHGSSWYNCNRFDEAEARAARDAQEQSRAALNRYLFYFDRFMNHMQSLKFENKLFTSVNGKMEEMQQHNMSWIEVQFLKKAVDVLCQCRETLMYTYVFAYFLRKNNQSIIFEDNQKDLERCTEVLSEYLERDITRESLADIKQKVQDKYRYCKSRREVLLEHVHEGYERDWWLYTE